MPIQILELIVKITVEEDAKGRRQDKIKNGAKQQEIVHECVQQVIRHLEQEKER